MFNQILISIIFFFILMYLSVNLLGLFVRGLYPKKEIERMKKEGQNYFDQNIEEYQRKQKWITIFALILNVTFFYLLFRIWNIGVVIAVIIIIVGRLPDLLWDIEHGKKTDPNLMKKNALYYISAFLPWLAYPVLYYSLYYF